MGRNRPHNHVSINVALYGRPRRWAMTERGEDQLMQTGDSFHVGASSFVWDKDGLTIEIEERSVPDFRRLKGRVRVLPKAIVDTEFLLSPETNQSWWPIAPLGRIDVEFEQPALKWSGSGYLDSNSGDAMLEEGFVRWDWSRCELPEGALLSYAGHRLNGAPFALGLSIDQQGRIEEREVPPSQRLPKTLWQIDRRSPVYPGSFSKIVKTLEDTPFYARSLIEQEVSGGRHLAMHETLDCRRFANPIVKAMLPFRMPRKTW